MNYKIFKYTVKYNIMLMSIYTVTKSAMYFYKSFSYYIEKTAFYLNYLISNKIIN